MSNCIVPGCPNSKYKKSSEKIKFHSFPPERGADAERRRLWIKFCNRVNKDGTVWEPSKNSRICCKHFVNEQPFNHPKHPSFAPTIKPGGRPKSFSSEEWEKIVKKNLHIWTKSLPYEPQFIEINTRPKNKEKASNTLSYPARGMIRGKLNVFMSSIIGKDASTQVEHEPDPQPQTIRLMSNELSHGISHNCTLFKNASSGTDTNVPIFVGYESVVAKDMLFSATNVTQEAFDTLLALLDDFKPRVLARQEFLLMFLIKLRHNTSFDLLAMFFDTNRSTTFKSFQKVLEALYLKTRDSIFLQTEEEVEATMPEGLTYTTSTRVILDCLQVKNSKLSEEHKHKYLIGLTPNGRIGFVSTTFDGSQVHNYINSSLPLREKLYRGDTVVALREFPWIGVSVEPPKSPTIRKPVRIYAENVLNRIKGYKILSDCPFKLLDYSKEIAHIIAVIININTNVFVKRKSEQQNAVKLKGEVDNDHAYLNSTVASFTADQSGGSTPIALNTSIFSNRKTYSKVKSNNTTVEKMEF